MHIEYGSRFKTKQIKTERIAKRVVAEILDLGLAASTWRENNPKAYDDLLTCRLDIERSVQRIIGRSKR